MINEQYRQAGALIKAIKQVEKCLNLESQGGQNEKLFIDTLHNLQNALSNVNNDIVRVLKSK